MYWDYRVDLLCHVFVIQWFLLFHELIIALSSIYPEPSQSHLCWYHGAGSCFHLDNSAATDHLCGPKYRLCTGVQCTVQVCTAQVSAASEWAPTLTLRPPGGPPGHEENGFVLPRACNHILRDQAGHLDSSYLHWLAWNCIGYRSVGCA